MNAKYYLLILTGLFFLSAQPVSAQKTNLYTVFVGNYPDPQRQEFSLLSRYGFIYSIDLSQNMSKVYIGGFENEKDAKQLVSNIKAMYPNAAVEKRNANPTDEAIVIQVATRVFNQKIEWEKYQDLENIFALLNGDKVKVVTGIYPSMEAARKDLKIIRSSTFSDAFVKIVSRNILIDLGPFETGIKEPLIPINFNEESNAVAVKNYDQPVQTPVQRFPNNNPNVQAKSPNVQGQGYESVIPRTGNAGVNNPSNYETAVPGSPTLNNTSPKGGNQVGRIPINGKIKRRSALELQKVLKAYGTYTGSLDGYYGQGTQAGYEALKQSDKNVQKYVVLSDLMGGASSDQRPLQQAINNLLTDANASTVIDASSDAAAKAYQAYVLFNSLGPSNDVNQIMNAAIRQAYTTQNNQVPAPFDYTATYAYNDWNQLVLHIHFIHGSPNNSFAAPCWLIQRHPEVSTEAQSLFARANNNNYLIQECDQFMQWEEIRMLKAIARDFDTEGVKNPSADAAASSQRAQLYMTSAPLDKNNQLAYENWNRDLWASLNNWSSSDPLHKRLVDVLKIGYFQTQVRLEDYFMEKGFNTQQATGLAFATIKTIVGNDLQRFL